MAALLDPEPLEPEPKDAAGQVGVPATVDPHVVQAEDDRKVVEPADNHNDAPPTKVPGVGSEETAVLLEDDRI